MFIKKPADKKSIHLRKPVYGVGINDAKYKTSHTVNNKQYTCPIYTRWVNILSRCYSDYVFPDEVDSTMSKEWLRFSNFSKWYTLNVIEGYVLSKNMKVRDNKVYSAKMCLFVPRRVSMLFAKGDRGDLFKVCEQYPEFKKYLVKQ